MTGSPVYNRSKSLRKLSPDKRGSDSDEEEEPTISFPVFITSGNLTEKRVLRCYSETKIYS